ncbi:MAG: BamA/TamA family outer membrane protein [Firmicutes bacterium]|nr:BamA/TamA family outer membrane protein [Bacillota bacterium]
MRRSLRSALALMALLVAIACPGAPVWAQGSGAPESGARDWIVAEIVIVGNEHVEESLIREAVTRTRIGEPLDVEATNEDLQSIYELGYFYDVTASLEELPGAPGAVRVIIEVFEFPVIRRMTVQVEGVPESVAREWLGIREGQILNQRELEAGVAAVQDRALGEYDVYLRPAVVDLDEAEGVLTLEFRAARVAEIRLTGNEKTRDFVIEREITFEPGDQLRRDEVRRTIQRINMLGYFDDVSARFYEVDDPDALGVEIAVQERKTGWASFGVGYSSQDGFIGFIEAQEDNLFGRGQQANVRLEFGKSRSLYDLGFYEPYFLGSRMSLGFNLYNRSTQETFEEREFTDHRVGGDVTVGHPLGEYTRGFLRYKLENWTWTPVDSDDGESGATRSITLSTRTDTTDHPFSPTQGFRGGVSVEMAGGFLGGDTVFTKYKADVSNYTQVGSSGQTVAVRLMYGQGHRLPDQEKFRVGGAETVRGYDYGAFVGDRMMVLNAEYRFPIVDAVQGVVFADVGRAFREDEAIHLGDLKSAVGVGVRLDTPLGVVRIDYGIGEEGGRAYFSLGPAF